MAENANKNRKIAGIFALVLGLLTAGFVVTIIIGVEQGWYAKKTDLEGFGAIAFPNPPFVLGGVGGNSPRNHVVFVARRAELSSNGFGERTACRVDRMGGVQRVRILRRLVADVAWAAHRCNCAIRAGNSFRRAVFRGEKNSRLSGKTVDFLGGIYYNKEVKMRKAMKKWVFFIDLS